MVLYRQVMEIFRSSGHEEPTGRRFPATIPLAAVTSTYDLRSPGKTLEVTIPSTRPLVEARVATRRMGGKCRISEQTTAGRNRFHTHMEYYGHIPFSGHIKLFDSFHV